MTKADQSQQQSSPWALQTQHHNRIRNLNLQQGFSECNLEEGTKLRQHKLRKSDGKSDIRDIRFPGEGAQSRVAQRIHGFCF